MIEHPQMVEKALAQMQAHGYIDEQTLQSLTHDEYLLVMDRARTEGYE